MNKLSNNKPRGMEVEYIGEKTFCDIYLYRIFIEMFDQTI
jgi:hypothetical protein